MVKEGGETDSFSFRKTGNDNEPLDPDSCGEVLVNESDEGMDFQDSCEFNRNDRLRALFVSTILEPDRGSARVFTDAIGYQTPCIVVCLSQH
jgi:hypothetical protein